MTRRSRTPDPATRLERLHRRTRWRTVLLGAVEVVGGGLVLASFAALAAGRPGEAHPLWRSAVLLAASVGGLWLVLDRIVGALGDLGGVERFVADLDRAGGHRNLLTAAREATRGGGRWREDGVPDALTERLLASVEPRLGRVDPVGDLGLAPVRRVFAVGGFLVALALLPALLTPAVVTTGMERLGRPLEGAPRPATIGLYLEPAAGEVVSGETLDVTAVDFGTPLGETVCEVRGIHGGWRSLPAVPDTLPPGAPMIRNRVVLTDVTEDLVYRFRRDGMVTHTAQIRVIHPPLLASLVLEVRPPAYTGLPVRTHDPCPAVVEAPVGSRLSWTGRASRPVAAAGFAVADTDTLPWEVSGADVAGMLVLDRDLRGAVVLRDARGLVDPGPVMRELRAVPDAPPTADLRRPGDDGRMPPDGRIVLDLTADDDYGIARLDLLLRRESPGDPDTTWTRLAVPTDTLTTTTTDGHAVPSLRAFAATGAPGDAHRAALLGLDAAAVDLLPGEALLVTAEAVDGRRPGSPGRVRTRTLRLVVPSAAELLAEQVETSDERRDDMADLQRRNREMVEDLERIERELKKNAELDFARRQELEEALQRQGDLQSELSEVADDLRRELDAMAEHNLADPQLLEKMERVAELLEEVRSDELERLQQELRDAMEHLSEQEVRAAMEEISEHQQEYLERLDRAIALLEDMRKEQELAGLTAAVEEMMRRQEDLVREQEAAEGDAQESAGEDGAEDAEGDADPDGESGEPGDADDRAERQERLAEEMEELRERIAEAQERLAAEAEGAEPSPAAEAMQEALEEALERMEEDQAEQSMREAAEGMSADSPPSPPSDSQHEAMRRLASLYHVLLQGQQSMQMAMEDMVGDALRRLASDLLDLSRRQETLAATIPNDLRDVRAPDLAREQMRLLRATASLRDRLAETLARSPNLSSGLLQGLDRITDTLDDSFGYLRDGWGGPASTASRDGLGAMNRLVMNLLTSAQSSGGGGGGSCPMPSLGDQLEQMAREQAGLNGLADQLNRQMREQGLSQEMRSQMDRLQAGQQGMAGRLHEAAEEDGDPEQRERLLGDLDELARDMERVADSLDRGELNEEVLRRQERILGRLLDARNSVRRRDYERRREGRTADVLFRDQAGEPDDAGAEAERERLRRRREQVEHVPPDYRDLVRRYFRALGERTAPDGEVRP